MKFMDQKSNVPIPQAVPQPSQQVTLQSPQATTITTPNQIHQQTLDQIKQQLHAVTNEHHPVAPVTGETPLDIGLGNGQPEDNVPDFYERAVLGKPGHEPSKSFLNKLLSRVRKKNPDAKVVLK